MIKERYNIGISCIGGGVGQAIINSLRLSTLPIQTIGLGNNPFAFGAYECDRCVYTPSIYSDGYIDELVSICRSLEIDLLIPGLDDDALLLANNIERLNEVNTKVIVSGVPLIALARDKEHMSAELNKIANVFVRSYNQKSISDDIESGRAAFPLIAKPRRGCASKGVYILNSVEDLRLLSKEHIIQELAVPNSLDPNYEVYIESLTNNHLLQVSEISIQVVYSPAGRLMGRMSSYNKLNNGVPIEILPYENPHIWEVVDQLIPTLLNQGLRGPLNMQGRMTKAGLKIFEINPRFTGITGLRALMGFNEVEACVKEWLGIDAGQNYLELNRSLFGVRQTADKVIPIERDLKVKALSEKIVKWAKKKKTILVTGAAGYLGQNLIKSLSESNIYRIWAFDLDKSKTIEIVGSNCEKVFDHKDLEFGKLPIGYPDTLLHLGFTRPQGASKDIAASLRFALDLFTRASMSQITAIINISSQSVYGQATPPPWSESSEVSPETTYAEAKYATEHALVSLGKIFPYMDYTSIRFSSIDGGLPGLGSAGFLVKLVQAALNGIPLQIQDGDQQFEILDIRDAISAIVALLESDSSMWESCYNVGSGELIDLKSISKKIASIVPKYNGGVPVEIRFVATEENMRFGMDSAKFRSLTAWSPNYCLDDTIASLVNHFQRGP